MHATCIHHAMREGAEKVRRSHAAALRASRAPIYACRTCAARQLTDFLRTGRQPRAAPHRACPLSDATQVPYEEDSKCNEPFPDDLPLVGQNWKWFNPTHEGATEAAGDKRDAVKFGHAEPAEGWLATARLH